METAVRDGLTKFVKKIIDENSAEAHHVIRRETESSKYRECSSPAEYERCESMLELAIERGWLDIAKILLEAGANPNYKSWDGTYSVMGACKKYGDEKLLEMLVKHGGVDDGSPLLHEPIKRTRQEELYGRGGNLIANLLEHLYERSFKARKRQYTAAARALADRDCYKILDKVLSLFGCKSMADFFRNHEVYVAKAGSIADDDMKFIMDAEFSYSDYFHADALDINDQMQFIKRALEHGVDGKGTIPQSEKKNEPVLRDFVIKEFKDVYKDGETQPLVHLHKRLYEAYLTLFPAKDLEAGEDDWLDRHNHSEEEYKNETRRFINAVPSLGTMLGRGIRVDLREIGVVDSEATIW